MPSTSNYPTSVDAFTPPTDTLGGPNGNAHDDSHRHLADAVLKVQTELGVDPSGSAATVKDRIGAFEALFDLNGVEHAVPRVLGGSSAILPTVSSTSTLKWYRLGGLVAIVGRIDFDRASASWPASGIIGIEQPTGITLTSDVTSAELYRGTAQHRVQMRTQPAWGRLMILSYSTAVTSAAWLECQNSEWTSTGSNRLTIAAISRTN